MNDLLSVARRNIRAFIESSGLDESSKRSAISCVEVLESAIKGQEGFVLVPVEPTEAMTAAAEEAHMRFGDMEFAIQAAISARPEAK